jgi:hypothetical protein
MALAPPQLKHYHVFIASPSEVNAERKLVRKYFDDFNRSTARLWNVQFDVIDWENYATTGAGRPQQLITEVTLDRYKDSLALVIGIMAQKFGMPSGEADSGTEEEFNWAMQQRQATGFPEIKWFFRKVDKLEFPADPDEAEQALEQWKKVRAFRKRMQDLNDNPVFYTEYERDHFYEVLQRDLHQWLTDSKRHWIEEYRKSSPTNSANQTLPPLPFDSEHYRQAVSKRFDTLNFEMLDGTGAYYSGVRLWSVFVPQSARECHQYNPRLLELPKDHQERLLADGEIDAKELSEGEKQADRLRQEYFSQPVRPVLEIIEDGLRATATSSARKLVLLGDPGAGKTSLIRYLALRWANIADIAARDTQPIPIVIELGAYNRWQCAGRKDFVRFLEESQYWYQWQPGVLASLLFQPGRILFLLDGLDEVFDPQHRESVVNDIQTFVDAHTTTPVVVTSRVIGYSAARLRDVGFGHFMLQDLDRETQIFPFLDQWHDETFKDAADAAVKRERLKKAIKDSKPIGILAGNPLVLTMMAILNRNQELPRDRSDLYEQASKLLLHSWDFERALANFPGLSSSIGLREKQEILRKVAWFMQADAGGLKGNIIAADKLEDLIEEYLRTDRQVSDARAVARAVVKNLRERTFILCFVGANSYAFVHRTFLEYFCAAEVVHQFNITKSLDEPSLLMLFEQHRDDDVWREVLRLICGQIDGQVVGRIVIHLIKDESATVWPDDSTPPKSVLLAIGCISELRNPARVSWAFEKLANHLLDVFRAGAGSEAGYEKLLQAIRDCPSPWPSSETIYAATKQRLQIPPLETWGSVYLVHFVGQVLPERSIQQEFLMSEHFVIRMGACRVLAEKWPDENTRQRLQSLAVDDPEFLVRNPALRMLTEIWPDESTRKLLEAWAIADYDSDMRSTALRELAVKWPDESTRKFFEARTIADEDSAVRSTALHELSEKWPGDKTNMFLQRRRNQVGFASAIWGQMHSEFGRLVFTRFANGVSPYFDPRQPLPGEHIKMAARTAGVPPDKIGETVRNLSEHMGWDITKGSGAK